MFQESNSLLQRGTIAMDGCRSNDLGRSLWSCRVIASSWSRRARCTALQRLELHGWIDGNWGVTSNNRRARIYKITAAGRKQLAIETRKYARLTLAIARVMGGE